MGRARYYGKKTMEGLAKPLPFGVKEAALNLYSELEFFIVHQIGKVKARRYRKKRRLKLHLGCGKNYKPGWVNVDIGNKVDLNLDLRRDLPFASRSSKVIYCEHFLEHIDYPHPARQFLKECYRVLEPGGLLSLSVPDTELILNSYVLGGTEQFYAAQQQWNPDWCQSKMDHVNFSFRQNGNHRYAYDFETLQMILQQTGFSEIERRAFDSDLDREDRDFGSLYVDCRKPL